MSVIFQTTPKATPPVKGSPDSAGWDLSASEPKLIPIGGRCLVDTGLVLEGCPEQTYLRIAPRSSLTLKGIDVGAGVVDADYRGKVKVVMINHGIRPFTVEIGDRIAQLIPEKISQVVMECRTEEGECLRRVDSIVSRRGAGGFGSTSIPQVPNGSRDGVCNAGLTDDCELTDKILNSHCC